MEDKQQLQNKFVLWTYADYGWHPTGYDTIKEALEATRYTSEFFITSGQIEYKVEQVQ